MSSLGRTWHGVTFAVATAALVLQLVLVVRGHGVLADTRPPALGTRLVRFVSYFTILSNLLVAATTLLLVTGRWGGPLFRVLRLNAVSGIAVTGLVHWFLLRPLLTLHGADRLADQLLHLVVPVLAVAGWVAFGPRGQMRAADLAPSAIFPALYLVWTLVHGAVSDWYPYPFVDVGEHGYAVVLLNALGVVILLVAVCLAALRLDRRLPGDH